MREDPVCKSCGKSIFNDKTECAVCEQFQTTIKDLKLKLAACKENHDIDGKNLFRARREIEMLQGALEHYKTLLMLVDADKIWDALQDQPCLAMFMNNDRQILVRALEQAGYKATSKRS